MKKKKSIRAEVSGPKPADRVRAGLDLENKVQTWLNDAGAIFAGGKELRAPHYVDFVVFEPFPCAIEVKSFSNPNSWRMTAKRLLAKRLSVAQQFGPHLPFLLVTQGSVLTGASLDIPFVDRILDGDRLPALQTFADLRVSQQMGRFLLDQAAKPVEITSPEDLDRQWSSALSLEELVLDGGNAPDGTLARAAHSLWSLPLGDRPLANTGREFYDATVPLEALEQLVSARISKIIDSEPRTAASRVEFWPRLRLSVFGWSISPSQTLVVRLRLGDSPGTYSKSEEDLADAALIRSAERRKEISFVCLLGTRGRLSKFPDGKLPASIAHAVNRLELAGWRVFPWDFADSTPRFELFVRALGKR